MTYRSIRGSIELAYANRMLYNLVSLGEPNKVYHITAGLSSINRNILKYSKTCNKARDMQEAISVSATRNRSRCAARGQAVKRLDSYGHRATAAVGSIFFKYTYRSNSRCITTLCGIAEGRCGCAEITERQISASTSRLNKIKKRCTEVHRAAKTPITRHLRYHRSQYHPMRDQEAHG